MNLSKWKTIVAIASLSMFAACSQKTSAHSSAAKSHSASNTKPAPDFTLQDASGAQVKLSSFRGKVVLLNFWATWCGPCNLEIPWFIGFEQQYKSAGLEVVGVSMDDDGWKVVKPYIEQKHINYEILLGNDSVTQLYGGVDSLPTSFLIDRAGHIAHVHVGLAGKDEYQNEIQQLLSAPAENNSGNSKQAGLLSVTAGLLPRAAK